MILLSSEQQPATGSSMADAFTQALADVPAEVLTADDAQPTAPSAPEPPLSTATAPVAPIVPALVPPVAPETPPTSPAEAVPPTTELPGVLRQVQELTGLLSQATPEAAKDFLATLSEVNEPLAKNLTLALREYLTEEQGALTSIPVELPPVKFDFGSKSQDDYDEQTWGEFQTAKTDIDEARNLATNWQQRAIHAEQLLAQQQQQSQPSSSDFIDARAQTILTALSAVPAIAGNQQAYELVHGSLLNKLEGLPAFVEGVKASKDGNQLGAYQAGLLVDQAINQYIADAAKTIAPPAPVTPPAPPAVPLVPAGAPARSTAIPPVTPTPGASFVDGLLANIGQLEQTNAAPW